MAKSLNDILKGYSDAIAGKRSSETVTLTTGENPGVDYADKMKDTRDFIAQHSVEKFDDRVGNGPDVYQAAKIKKAEMKRHGHEPKPKDIKVYKKTNQIGESKDEREYGYEGDMALTQLKTIMRNAEHLMKMMKPDTDLPEWVQSKITKAEDYISTAHDYLTSEMNEESKCNMTEAGKMCEVHGKKACPKEDSASDKEPRYNGKKKEGKQLITDKNIQEKLTKDMSVGDVIKDFQKSDDPRFKGDTAEERRKRAIAAWYKMKNEDVNESISDQRSSKSTASEKAREKIFSAMEKKKEKILDKKLEAQTKMKEQAAPVETPITFPVTNSREGLKV